MGPITVRQIRSVVAGCIVLGASSVAVAAPGKPAAKAPPGAASAVAAGTVGLHVTVYETKLPADRVAAVDVAALLAKADTTAGLQAALAKFGPTRILYHAYQLTALAGESRIHLGSRRPFVTQSRAIPSRPRASGSPRLMGTSRVNTIQYENVGMIFKLVIEPTAGKPKGTLAAHMELELSAFADSSVEIAKGVQAPEVRQVRVDKVAGMRVGRPIVAVQVDGSASAKDAPATAYVFRVLLSETP